MDTSTDGKPLRDDYNLAASAILRGRKGELRITHITLSRVTGISHRQVKQLMNDHASIHVGDLIRLAKALDLDPVDVLKRIL